MGLILPILLMEDDEPRHSKLTAWLPKDVRLVWAKDAGVAIGILERLEPGNYAAFILDHDLSRKLRSADSRFLSGADVVDALLRNPKTKGSRARPFDEFHRQRANAQTPVKGGLRRDEDPVCPI